MIGASAHGSALSTKWTWRIRIPRARAQTTRSPLAKALPPLTGPPSPRGLPAVARPAADGVIEDRAAEDGEAPREPPHRPRGERREEEGEGNPAERAAPEGEVGGAGDRPGREERDRGGAEVGEAPEPVPGGESPIECPPSPARQELDERAGPPQVLRGSGPGALRPRLVEAGALGVEDPQSLAPRGEREVEVVGGDPRLRQEPVPRAQGEALAVDAEDAPRQRLAPSHPSREAVVGGLAIPLDRVPVDPPHVPGLPADQAHAGLGQPIEQPQERVGFEKDVRVRDEDGVELARR